MRHRMHLNNDQFNWIKNGTKTLELRLNDEKRQLLKERDLIEFTNRLTKETIVVEVLKLHKYSNFLELYKYLDNISMGYDKDMERYYSKEEEDKYGVVGIEIKMIEEWKWKYGAWKGSYI